MRLVICNGFIFQWNDFHTQVPCVSLKIENLTQHCLLIHYCTQKITLLLLQLDVINTTVHSGKECESYDSYKQLSVEQLLFFTLLCIVLESRWRRGPCSFTFPREDFWISNGCSLSLFPSPSWSLILWIFSRRYCHILTSFWIMNFWILFLSQKNPSCRSLLLHFCF